MDSYKIHIIHKNMTEPQLLFASDSIEATQKVFRSMVANTIFISSIGTMELLKVSGKPNSHRQDWPGIHEALRREQGKGRD